MMAMPTKEQIKKFKIFCEEVAPWCYMDEDTLETKLRNDAPEEVKKI